MSAKHDSNQGFKFLFENLYKLYQREKVETYVAPEIVPVPGQAPKGEAGPRNGQVLKFRDQTAANVQAYRPVEILNLPKKPIEAAPAVVAERDLSTSHVDTSDVADPVVLSLKSNLDDLRELQSRLHFMLKELEEITEDEE